MPAHIHAENVKLYAEDAAETDKPWERWEAKHTMCARDVKYATLVGHPEWSKSILYRRKPRTHMVNGFEVPEPMREVRYGTWVWVADPGHVDFCHEEAMANAPCDFEWIKRGLVHATKDAAIANAKAMLNINPYA